MAKMKEGVKAKVEAAGTADKVLKEITQQLGFRNTGETALFGLSLVQMFAEAQANGGSIQVKDKSGKIIGTVEQDQSIEGPGIAGTNAFINTAQSAAWKKARAAKAAKPD